VSVLFLRTIRSLSSDAPQRRHAAVVIGLAGLGVWLMWALVARVSIVVVSARARLEARQAAHQLAIPQSGTVAVANLTLGRAVRRGEILIELDARDEVIRRARLIDEISNAERGVAAMQAQIVAGRALADAQRRSSETSLRQVREETAGGRELARIERERAERTARLGVNGLVPRVEVDETSRRAAAAESRVRGFVAAEEKSRRILSEVTASAEAQLRALENDRIEIEQQLAAARTALWSTDVIIERMRVRSPVDGHITSSIEPKPGAWLAAGEKLCSIATAEPVEVTAWFPLESMPVIRAGQPASVWINYVAPRARKVIRAVVTSVEHDPAGSEFKVHLRLAGTQSSSALVGQGFPAVTVVEVQRVTPFQALLQTAGMAHTGD
jgi:membrane fusion protein, adhesin transport system